MNSDKYLNKVAQLPTHERHCRTSTHFTMVENSNTPITPDSLVARQQTAFSIGHNTGGEHSPL